MLCQRIHEHGIVFHSYDLRFADQRDIMKFPVPADCHGICELIVTRDLFKYISNLITDMIIALFCLPVVYFRQMVIHLSVTSSLTLTSFMEHYL